MYAWGAAALPFMEEGGRYDLLEVERCQMDLANEVARERIPVFLCPSDWIPEDNRGGWTPSNYVGVNLTVSGPHPSIQGYARTVEGVFPNWHGGWTKSIRDITDGTSNTLLLSERRFHYGRAGLALGRGYLNRGVGGNPYFDNTARINGGVRVNGRNWSEEWGFSSEHPGGVNVVLCDGSVRFLSQNITTSLNNVAPPGMLQNLSGINDGNVVELP